MNDIPAPGIVAVAWAMIRQMQAVAERAEKAAERLEAANAESERIAGYMRQMVGELGQRIERADRSAAIRNRRECGIPDHEFAEDAVG